MDSKLVSNDNLNNWIYETQVEQWLDILDNWFNIDKNTRTDRAKKGDRIEYENISKFVKWKTIVKYPGAKWVWCHVSQNPNITWEMIANSRSLSHDSKNHGETICNNLEYPWDWFEISSNPNITWNIISNNPDYPWNWFAISSNPSITWDNIQSNPDYPWSWDWITLNLNITWDIIYNNPDKPWDWSQVLKYKEITGQFIIDNFDRSWMRIDISKHPAITLDIIKDNMDKDWEWYGISSNPNINFQFIKDNLDKDWDWERISKNSAITWEDIHDNMDYPWRWDFVLQNKNITWDIILNTLELWFYKYKNNFSYPDWMNVNESNKGDSYCHSIARNPNITWDIIASTLKSNMHNDDVRIRKYWNAKYEYAKYTSVICCIDKMHWSWSWVNISHREDIIGDMVKCMVDKQSQYHDMAWLLIYNELYYANTFNTILEDPNLTFDCIERIKMNIPYYDIYDIQYNSFDRQLDLIKQDCIIKWNAVNKIRKWWLFKIYLNPFHRVGAKRLERSYLEMLEEDNLSTNN